MQMKPQDQAATKQAFAAALDIMYNKKVFPMFEQGLTQDKPLPELLSGEAAGLLQIIYKKSKGKIPRQVLIPVGTMILMEMADFMVKAGIANPTKEDIAQAQKLMVEIALAMFGKQGQQPPQGQQQGRPSMPPQQAPQARPAPQGQPMPQQPQRGLLSQGV